MNNSIDEKVFPARHCFESYCITMFNDYQTPRHIKYLCAALQEIINGGIKKLIITMPPRHGKSMTLAEFFPAWALGKNPKQKIIYATYQQNLATDYGRKVRNQLLDPLHSTIFPNCKISPDSMASHRFNTTVDGTYYAVGRGAAVTGKGANIFICDDMFKDHAEAASIKVRNNVKDFYKTVAKTRLEKDAAEIICGTRWHEDDLIGWVLDEFKEKNWTIINFPAEDESKDENDISRWLWPEMFSPERYLENKETLGSYYWNALYQQRPSPVEGNFFKRSDWRFYNELPSKFEMAIQAWDLTFRKTDNGSFVVGQAWGKIGPKCYLIDMYRQRVDFTETLKAITSMCLKHPYTTFKLIEKAANGSAAVSILQKEIDGIIEVPPRGTKEERAFSVAHLQKSGNVYLPNIKENPWVETYIEEHTLFPNSKNNDIVDATSMALSYFITEMNPEERLKKLLMM